MLGKDYVTRVLQTWSDLPAGPWNALLGVQGPEPIGPFMRQEYLAAMQGSGSATAQTGWGLRILTLDGGGTKALSTIEILKRLEQRTQKPVHETFDLVCGTRCPLFCLRACFSACLIACLLACFGLLACLPA